MRSNFEKFAIDACESTVQCAKIKWILYEGELSTSHCIYLWNIHAQFEKKVTEWK